jgi:hypothetical protein
VHIDTYSFGKIVIDGTAYDDDVIIAPDGVRSGWWRREAHEASLFDLAEALDPPPARLIVGTGSAGRCQVLDEVRAYCASQKIELLVLPTPEAVVEYNSLEDAGSTVAALHLTC